MEWLANIFGAYVALGKLGMAVAGLGLIGMVVCAFLERGWEACLGLAALVFGVSFFGGGHPFAALADHAALAAAAVIGYFVAGSFWSVAKFRLYAGSLKNKFRDFKKNNLAKAGSASVEALDPAALEEFRKQAAAYMAIQAPHGYPVKTHELKATILFWMGWWPLSVVGYILDEPIKRLMETLYRMFSGVYAKIAADQSKEYVADMGK